METKTYYANPKKIKLGILCSYIFLLVGVIGIVITAYKRPLTLWEWTIYLNPIGFGGGGLMLLLQRLKRKTPTVVIDADGVELVHPSFGRRIAWANIKTTYIKTIRISLFQEMRCLCFTLHDPENVITSVKTGWQKTLLDYDKNLVGSPFAVTDYSLDEPIEDVQLFIENHLYERRKAQEATATERLPDVPDVAEPLRIAAR